MEITPFLKQVAQVYATCEAQELADYCFVFPNKRNVVFFSQYLKEALAEAAPGTSCIFPETTTIADFTHSLTPTVTEATRYQQLFLLYNCYCSIMETPMDFDRFRFWGEMLMSDFSDVDSYMADARSLFTNIKHLREINSTYLTDDQREIIRTYWGEERPEESVDRFWTHIDRSNDDSRSSTTEHFLKLWEILWPLYEKFTEALRQRRLATRGMIERQGVECLREMSPQDLPCRRYVFVGFNVLTIAELKIFEILKRMDCADFYWDVNSPALNLPGNKAARIILDNKRRFPSRYDLDEAPITRYGKIEVVGIPSRSGQAKYAAKVIGDWCEQGVVKTDENDLNTAIVLPDESMLTTVIEAMPPSIGSINVTMGYPVRLTPVASMLRHIVSMHLRASSRGSERVFFYEDVTALASHPLLSAVDPAETHALLTHIAKERLFTLSQAEIEQFAPSIADIFATVEDDRDFDEVCTYIQNVVALLRRAMCNGDNTRAELVLTAYSDALAELREAVHDFGISMTEATVFQLLESAMRSAIVNFKGEPLRGVQIMGFLETRSLDFENVVILSMNERIFPRRHMAHTFIPEALRRGYGLPTVDMREATFSYYFYRLLSRARRATLLYDSRTVGGVRTSEKSRYLSQLLYLLNNPEEPIVHHAAQYPGSAFTRELLSVEKTPAVMEKLKAFTRPGSGSNLSASAINTYIKCPLEFYLKVVEGLDPPNDLVDFMDAATFGTIVHTVMECIYTDSFPGDKELEKRRRREAGDYSPLPPLPPRHITKAFISGLLKEKVRLQRLITASINFHYNNYEGHDERLTALNGDAYALGQIIMMYVEMMLKADEALAPFTFVGAEVEQLLQLPIDENLHVNFKQLIDRVDHPDGRALRIVDYKTGSEHLDFKTVEDLFKLSSERPKAILQLLLYCNVYNMATDSDRPIQPIIYPCQTLATEGVRPLNYNGAALMDYHTVNQKFMELLRQHLRELFDPSVPFTATSDPNSCGFCNFKELCGRQ